MSVALILTLTYGEKNFKKNVFFLSSCATPKDVRSVWLAAGTTVAGHAGRDCTGAAIHPSPLSDVLWGGAFSPHYYHCLLAHPPRGSTRKHTRNGKDSQM